MTFKERFIAQNPLEAWRFNMGCTHGCPSEFGLESENESMEACMKMNCVECWDRQMPESAVFTTNDPVDCPVKEPAAFPFPANDPVNHPSHYTQGGIECIDAIEAALSSHKDPMDAWLTGQVLKYLWRWPLKNGLEDLEKAQFYLNKLIERKKGGKEDA